MADNLLDKASILLTPTAYDNGSMLSIKPTNGDGDFTFSRNSAATRVNAQGLVENVQILSGDLVQNGSFSQIGAEEVTNGSFTNGSTDWTLENGWSIGDDKAISDGSGSIPNTDLIQANVFTTSKSYKVTLEIKDYISGNLQLQNNTTNFPQSNGIHTIYSSEGSTSLILRSLSFIGSITNISVKEVGQNWTFGDGFTPDQANSKATCDGTQSAATNLTQTISTNIQNKLVRVSFTLDYTAGVLLGSLSGTGAVDFNNITSSGTYTAEMTSNEVNPLLILQGDANFIGSITNIVIKEVTNDTNLPRINYENGCGSWLLEPQSTNIYLNSETLSTQNNTTLASTYTVSFYGTGTITFSGTYTGSLVGTSLTDRVSATFTATAGTLTSTVTGTVTKGQLENLNFASSYIPTSGASSTRLQDIATNSGNSTLINSTEGVLYAEIFIEENIESNVNISLSAGVHQENLVKLIYLPSTNELKAEVYNSVGVSTVITYSNLTLGQYNKISTYYDSILLKLYVNGTQVGSAIMNGLPSGLDRLSFDRADNVANFFGKTKALAVYKEALTDAELTLLTTI